MLHFFAKLFSTDFMAHVYCLRLPEVIWLHVLSDVLIACSYFVIPLALLSLVRRREDLAFSWMFSLFGLFILACGATHVLSVWTLWNPMYRLEGVVKAITALASMPTAFLLFRLLPKVSALPSPAQLRQEIAERRSAQEQARVLNLQLEHLVEERTAELRQINARLKQSEARFRTAAEAATNIIWTADANGEMRGEQADWAAFTGQTYEEYQGRGWTSKLHPEDRDASLQAWNRAVLERSGKFTFENRVCRIDGEWRLCRINAVPILDENQSVREWVGTHTDITEQRGAEEDALLAKTAAEEANSAKSAFLANMSHELRTPLNAIIGYSEMLQEQLEEEGQSKLLPDLQKVSNAGKHLLALINSLLDLRKIEAGHSELNLETIVIADLVRDVAGTAHPLMEQKANRFEVRIAAGLGVMESDATRIRQSLLNLLSNAAKFTEHGSVIFETESAGSDIVFRVSDTGIGVAAEKVGKLFEPFSQADRSISRIYGGTGLGLAITRSYCRMMGGEVSLSSAHAEGSVFTIRLPRYLEITREHSPAVPEREPEWKDAVLRHA